MVSEAEKMEKAKNVLLKIAKGIDPLTGEIISENSFLNDARIIRCFYYVTEVLDKAMKGTYGRVGKKPVVFSITPEQKNEVKFPESNIGVNEFARCINMYIDTSKSKKVTGVRINKGLKKMGILSEQDTGNGKTRTITNSESMKYGFETEKKIFNGSEYEMVVINNKGKKYLLDNIESLMSDEQED
jgi:hypothetical protein